MSPLLRIGILYPPKIPSPAWEPQVRLRPRVQVTRDIFGSYFPAVVPTLYCPSVPAVLPSLASVSVTDIDLNNEKGRVGRDGTVNLSYEAVGVRAPAFGIQDWQGTVGTLGSFLS